MEIFITDQHVQFVTGNGDGDYGMAFLVSGFGFKVSGSESLKFSKWF